MMARGEESRNLRGRGGGGVAEFEGSRRGRGRGGGGVAALEGSLIGWATPAAARLRFKTESRGVMPGVNPSRGRGVSSFDSI